MDNYPVWTPDGRRVVFSSGRASAGNLYWRAADGAGQAPSPAQGSGEPGPPSQGRLATRADEPTLARRPAITGRPGEPGRRPTSDVRPLLQTQFEERNGIVSPDGRWLAYESNSSSRFEIYVRPFPNVGDGQWQVSTTGGTRPLWSRNGQELFYFAADDALMAVRIEARGTSWNAGPPAKLLEAGYFAAGGNPGRTYDVSPDGQRFLMIKQGGGDRSAAPPQIIVVQNWLEELKRLVP